MHRRRVVITGLGVIAPNGCGKDPFWQACLRGQSGVSAITRFDASTIETRIAGQVQDFSPEEFGLTTVECETLGRGTQFAIAAANLALKDAAYTSLHQKDRAQMGVYLGTAMASADEGERHWAQLTEHGLYPPHEVLGYRESMGLITSNNPSVAVAAHHRLEGPTLTFSTGCSAGADAIGQAAWLIQEGQATRMLAGGSDSALSLLSLGVFGIMRALSRNNKEPERASRPYDASRDGFVLAEGAAVLLLEDEELALARGAHIYAEILAFASNGNAYHMTSLPEDGAPLQALLQQILTEAGLSTKQLGYINSHGSSTLSNDLAETAAYKGAFGSHAYHIPISSTKSLIGHTQGAASAIETLVTALALDQQALPPTINLETPDPDCDLDYIPNHARYLDASRPLRFALTHSSGFGGVNTALLLARHEAHSEQKRPRLNMSTLPPRRVVISGLGVVAPAGIGKEAFWLALRQGKQAVEPLKAYGNSEQHLHFAGAVNDLRVEDYLSRKLAQRTDRMTHLALAAVHEALLDARLTLERENPQRVGASLANTLGGCDYVVRQMEAFYTRGPRFISAYTAIAWLHVANVGQVAVRYGLQGYSKTPVNDLAGGLNALGLAYTAIRRGAADIVIAGGSEAPLHPYALQVLDTSLPLCKANHPQAYRPFDLRANGVMIAEGAGVCILEEYEHARQRGAPIYGELVGYAQACSPGGLASHNAPGVEAYIHALRSVLAEGHLTAEDLACVYLDGRAIPTWDRAETLALRSVFGSAFENLACSIPRTQFGHGLAAAGAFDSISALLGLNNGLIPPTLNCEEPDERSCPPGLVREKAQEQRTNTSAALVCARSIGGSHVVLALRKV